MKHAAPPQTSRSRRRRASRPARGAGTRTFLHDLSSPLAAIRLSAHALRASATLSPRNLADVQRIEAAAGTVAQMAASWTAPPMSNGAPARARDGGELVDLYAVCCDLAEVRRRAGGTTIECRAFGDPRGRWDRLQVQTALTDILDHALTHLGNGTPLTLTVTGMASHVRVDVHGLGPLSPAKRRTFLGGLSRIGDAPAGTTVAATASANAGSVFTLRLPR